MVKAVEWCGDTVRFLDQTKLPLEEVYYSTREYTVLADAIRRLKIRGAPLIGIAAAYALCLAARPVQSSALPAVRQKLTEVIGELAATRPTAVNLFWALERMQQVLNAPHAGTDALISRLIEEALEIHRDDEECCRRIGEHGAALFSPGARILTHCNTGALATGGEGTAQSVITTAHRQGKVAMVFADETRPLLQGTRLTAWELTNAGVNVTLITDSMAAFLMQQQRVDAVIVGADRIAANGDVANKVGTYTVAVAAHYHGIPFYVAAPTSTIDPACPNGAAIPIEERDPKEVTEGFGRRTAPEGVAVYSPAFDRTPAELISAIITERGVHTPPYKFTPSIHQPAPGSKART